MKVQKIKALLLDDSAGFLESFKKTLESKNCEVDCVSTTKEALSRLIYDFYHIIFIDCILNTERGPDVIQSIREILGSSVQIVVMSGVVPGKSLSTYMDLGVSDFLSKPISDKEISAILKDIRDKYRFGEEKSNLLNRVFSKGVSRIDALKDLISLKKLKGCDFFIYLGYALSSKESLSVSFKSNNQNHKISLHKGKVIDYECGSVDFFIDSLSSKNFIESKQAFMLRQKTEKDCVDYLLADFILSPQQLIEVKYDLLINVLKSIHPDTELSVSFDMSSVKDGAFLIFDQNDYADLVLSFLRHKFSNELFHLFDKNFMKKHLTFSEKTPRYPTEEIENLVTDLKSGMKLEAVYKKHFDDKNKFCFFMIYILLKGGAFVSESSVNLKYYFLIERYNHLYRFIKNTEQPEDIFKTFAGISTLSVSDFKEVYSKFTGSNHPDKLMGMGDLPKDLFEKINQVQRTLKIRYEQSVNPKLRDKIEKEKREKQMNQLIVLREKEKIIERYLLEKKYKQAFELLDPLREKMNKKNINIVLLYLWLYYKSGEELELEKNDFIQGMKLLRTDEREYASRSLFHYIMGLHYLEKQDFSGAKMAFKRAKKLDPSFSPCYEEIKKCDVKALEIKSMGKNSFITKLSQLKLKDFKKSSLMSLKKRKKAR